jgi:hypothetical protein
METDPLQQLRDVHMPMDPAWWPPAIGWWLLAIVLAAGVAWLIVTTKRAHARKRPVREARALIDRLFDQARSGAMTPIEFLHAGNEVLKRALVPGLGQREFASLAGEKWLHALDTITETDHFTNGPGRILGNERFQKEPNVDPEALHQELQLVLAKVTP